MSEKKTEFSIEERLAALKSLSSADKIQRNKAIAEAYEIKKILLEKAKKETILNTIVEKQAKDLIQIMFNDFGSTEFDELINELQAVSPSPSRIDSREVFRINTDF